MCLEWVEAIRWIRMGNFLHKSGVLFGLGALTTAAFLPSPYHIYFSCASGVCSLISVGASSLIEQLLPPHLQKTTYIEQDLALRSWRECLPPNSLQPESPTSHLQKAWDKPRVQSRWDSLFSNCVDPQARARLMATQTKESGAWLNASYHPHCFPSTSS